MLSRYPRINCTGCEACVNACPVKCIDFVQNQEGFFYPQINEDKCIHCQKCERACPSLAEKESAESVSLPEGLAVINNNLEQRKASSSGGVFVLVANLILERHGVVFGAAFSQDFRSVEHIAVTDKEQVQKLQGSKYVQSRIGNTYSEAERFLKEGREVLFTGTPCQISGLLSYLGKPYDNLYTLDFICHGVPSPGIWSSYLDGQEQIKHTKVCAVAFRNKRFGWMLGQMKIDFFGGKTVSTYYHDDLYVRGFLADLFLRPSCYQCDNKGLARHSDLTLGDFWGVKQVAPEMNDFYGTSFVLTHTDKGKTLLASLKDIRIRTVDLATAVEHNPAAVRSVNLPEQREIFFSSIQTESISKVLRKMCRLKPKQKIKRLLRNALYRVKALKYRS